MVAFRALERQSLADLAPRPAFPGHRAGNGSYSVVEQARSLLVDYSFAGDHAQNVFREQDTGVISPG